MDYEGEWNWGRIAFVLIILIAFAFSVYYLFFQPREVEPVNNNKCDPFPAKIDRYVCDGINKRTVLEQNSFIVCIEYDDEGNCINRSWVPPKEIYLVDYNNSRADAHLSYLSVTFKSTDDVERFFGKNFGVVDDICSNVSQPKGTFGGCTKLSIDGAEGFFLEYPRWDVSDKSKTSMYVRFFVLLDGDTIIEVTNDAKSQGDLLGFSELKQLILDFKEYKIQGAQR